jgi:hypothetical protein
LALNQPDKAREVLKTAKELDGAFVEIDELMKKLPAEAKAPAETAPESGGTEPEAGPFDSAPQAPVEAPEAAPVENGSEEGSPPEPAPPEPEEAPPVEDPEP